MISPRTRQTISTEIIGDMWSGPTWGQATYQDQLWDWNDHGLTLSESFRQAAMAGFPGPWQTVIAYFPSQDIAGLGRRNEQMVYWLQNALAQTAAEGIVRVGARTGKAVPYNPGIATADTDLVDQDPGNVTGRA